MVKLNGKKRYILVVEDDKINQKLIQNLLEEVHYNVFMHSNAEDAINACSYQKFDLILMDLNLPGIGGIEATESIHMLEDGKFKSIPIIGMSATTSQEIYNKCIKARMNGLIGKPIQTDNFYKMLGENLKDSGDQFSSINIDHALEDLGGDKAFLKELIEDFIGEEYSQVLVGHIEKAIKCRDFNIIYKRSHKLKGAAASIHAKSIYDIAYQLELKGKNNESDGLEKLLNALKEEYQIMKSSYKKVNWTD